MRFAYDLCGPCCTAIPFTRRVSRSLRAKSFRSKVMKSAEIEGETFCNWTVFLTLTFPVVGMKDLSEVDRCRLAWKTWKMFRALMWDGYVYKDRRRKFPFQFILVMELTKQGIPHFHVILDRYIPVNVVRRAWVAAGGGRVIKIEKIIHGPKSALRYLSKYITKSFSGMDVKGVRRWSYSRGKLPKLEKKSLWVAGDDYDLAVQNQRRTVFVLGPEGIEDVFLPKTMMNCRGKAKKNFLEVRSSGAMPGCFRGFEDSIYAMFKGWDSREIERPVKSSVYWIRKDG